MKLKTVHVPRGYTGLHCEVAGCIVNIEVGLENTEGQAVTSISISADAYAGEPAWQVHYPLPEAPWEGTAGAVALRVVREIARKGDPHV